MFKKFLEAFLSMVLVTGTLYLVTGGRYIVVSGSLTYLLFGIIVPSIRKKIRKEDKVSEKKEPRYLSRAR